VKWFYYMTPANDFVRIAAQRKPGPNTKPRNHCWPCHEVTDGKWCAHWEITWGRLSKLQFIGSVNPVK